MQQRNNDQDKDRDEDTGVHLPCSFEGCIRCRGDWSTIKRTD